VSAPAGWYPDPAQQHEQRYWDGMGWTEHVFDAPRPAPVAAPWNPYSVPPVATMTRQEYATSSGYTAAPTSASGNEILKFIGLLAAWFGVYLAIGVVVGLLFGAGSAGGTQLELEQQQQTAQSVAQLLGIGTTLVIGAFLAPKVGYRSRDTWMQLIPIWNLIIGVKWLWRLACYDRHYWAPAPH
jgi:Protein of unknown function (DUF2510)